jgi:glycosyltransferase involved in cell wall biosynthesis
MDTSNNLISVSLCIYKISIDLLTGAINSVLQQSYTNFEFIIINDGIPDPTIVKYLTDISDSRVKLVHQKNSGVCSSRNRFLSLASGDIITFIDADNKWDIDYLCHVNETYNDTNISTAYAKLKLSDGTVIFKEFDYEALLIENFIDLNVFSFRKSVYTDLGGFDESLNRLVDYDLLLTYCKKYTPSTIDHIGCYYYSTNEDKDRITIKNSFHYNRYTIKKKHTPTPKLLANKTMLCILDKDQPHSYFTELGARVNVIDGSDSSLNDKIHTLKPDIIHIPSLQLCARYCKILDNLIPITTSIPITISTGVRSELIDYVLSYPNVKHIFVPKHFIQKQNTNKFVISNLSFDPAIYFPSLLDRSLDKINILTIVSNITNSAFFLELVNEMPDFNFTLICPTKINGTTLTSVTDMSDKNVSKYMKQSHIYIDLESRIAEAMASGCLVLGRGTDETRDHIEETGNLYKGKADLIKLLISTRSWNQHKWNEVKKNSIEYAYTRFTPERGLKLVVDTLCSLLNN